MAKIRNISRLPYRQREKLGILAIGIFIFQNRELMLYFCVPF